MPHINKKKPHNWSCEVLCSRYLFSQVGQGIVLPSISVRWTLIGRKKPQPFGWGFLYSRYSFPGRPRYRHGVWKVPWTVPAVIVIHKSLRPQLSLRPFVFALLIFPGSHPPSIVSVHELNFCVRDGNRWTLMTINTNSMLEECLPFLLKTELPRVSVISRYSAFLFWWPIPDSNRC